MCAGYIGVLFMSSWVYDYLLIAVCISYFTWKAPATLSQRQLQGMRSCMSPAQRLPHLVAAWQRMLQRAACVSNRASLSGPSAADIQLLEPMGSSLPYFWWCGLAVSLVGGGRRQAGLMGLSRTPVKLLWCCLFLTNPDVCLRTPYLPNFPLSQPKLCEGSCVEINSWRMIPSLMPWFGFPALKIWNC